MLILNLARSVTLVVLIFRFALVSLALYQARAEFPGLVILKVTQGS